MAPTLSFLLSPLLILPLFITPSSSSIGDENWTTAVRKGTSLYKQLQSGCFPEKVNPVTVADLQAGEWDFLPPWPPTGSFLDGFTPFVAESFGWTQGKDYYYEEVYRKRQQVIQLTTEFINIYYPRYGFIGAYQTYRGSLDPIHWSDVTFALLKGITTIASSNIKGLRYIGRGLIGNVFTVSIINSAVLPGSSEKVLVFKPGDEAFVALLGTPNGVGGVHLLMEHKQALGLKPVSRIALILDGSASDPFLIFEVVNMRPPWGCGGATFNVGGGGVDVGAASKSSKVGT